MMYYIFFIAGVIALTEFALTHKKKDGVQRPTLLDDIENIPPQHIKVITSEENKKQQTPKKEQIKTKHGGSVDLW